MISELNTSFCAGNDRKDRRTLFAYGSESSRNRRALILGEVVVLNEESWLETSGFLREERSKGRVTKRRHE